MPMGAIVSQLSEDLAEICEEQFYQMGPGYAKPEGYFRSYLEQQQAGEIQVFVAHENDAYCGHCKLVWESNYPFFREHNIPETQDLNVLPRRRNQGIGTALIEASETAAASRGDYIGIGVGLHPGYNNAQRRYVQLGYIPDGHGVHYRTEPVEMGKSYRFDDDLALYFTKQVGI